MLINYSDTNYATQWNAVAQSNVTWGRDITAAESDSLTSKKEEILSTGVIASLNIARIDGVQQFYWSTVEAANTWVAFCETFTPAPTATSVSQTPTPRTVLE